MSTPYLLSSSTVVSASPEAAFAGVLAAPLPELFTRENRADPAGPRVHGAGGRLG